jgi:hypothetical protein
MSNVLSSTMTCTLKAPTISHRSSIWLNPFATLGVRVVVGSNPATPTIQIPQKNPLFAECQREFGAEFRSVRIFSSALSAAYRDPSQANLTELPMLTSHSATQPAGDVRPCWAASTRYSALFCVGDASETRKPSVHRQLLSAAFSFTFPARE